LEKFLATEFHRWLVRLREAGESFHDVVGSGDLLEFRGRDDRIADTIVVHRRLQLFPQEDHGGDENGVFQHFSQRDPMLFVFAEFFGGHITVKL